MKLWSLSMGVLLACSGGERFSEVELAADRIPDDPSTWTLEGNRPKMLRIEPGTFSMGSEPGAPGRTVDEQRHEVTLSRAFELASTEISQGIYRAVMGRNPSLSVGYDKRKMVGEKLPVQGVSFLDALRFCNAWSEAEGVEPSWDPAAAGYRLPTEAEWEYAARAGQPVVWVGASEAEEACRRANVADQALGSPDGFGCSDGHASKAPVGSLEANAWGLHDMTGNVWEWVWDRHGPHPEAAAIDPVGPAEGADRVYKGGSWLDGPEASRIAARRHGDPSELSIQLGFRLARSLPE
jgi:formylglycine-generating enzyme required for sulfatase activity